MIPLSAWLVLSSLLFMVGLGGVLTRKNTILFLVAVEIMMNAANLSLVAFWRYGMIDIAGPMLALFAIVIAGAESSVGLALIIAIYRHVRSVHMDDFDELRG